MGRPRVFVERRYLDYPAPTPQKTWCLLWQGAIDRDGYGCLTKSRSREKKAAHRFVWEAVYGPIPKGMVVRHKCDNRLCFRLSHLELGTIADNNNDARIRGHLGVRTMTPSEVVAIWNRHEAGETYTKIHADYADRYSLATVKRVKDYIAECLDLITDSPTETPAPPATPTAADASAAPPSGDEQPGATTTPAAITPG